MIPYDIRETPTCFLYDIPLGGVNQETITRSIDEEEQTFTIMGTREQPTIIQPYRIIHQGCFWGTFSYTLPFPPTHQITNLSHKRSNHNTLTIILLKLSTNNTHSIID